MSNLLIPFIILAAFALALTQVILSIQLIAKMQQLSRLLGGTRARPLHAPATRAVPPRARGVDPEAPPARLAEPSDESAAPSLATALLSDRAATETTALPAIDSAPIECEPTESVPIEEWAAGLDEESRPAPFPPVVPPPVPTSVTRAAAAQSDRRPRSAREWGLTDAIDSIDASEEIEEVHSGDETMVSRADRSDRGVERLATLRPMAEPTDPAERVRLELRLGRLLPVIVGSIALVLAGVWLVKLFADRGLLPPSRRILFAGIFSLGLIGCGEWFRVRVERISRALVVSGVLVGYATIWAAERLYGFLGAEGALVAFGAMTALALVLGRRFGHWVTAVGLVGGFLIPALVGPASYEPRVLFGCLALLQLGLATDRRVQSHSWLGIAAVIGSFAWFAFWLMESSRGALESPIAALYLFVTTFVAVPALSPKGWHPARSAAMALIPGWLLAMAFFFSLGESPAGLVGIGVFAAATLLTAAFRPGAWPFAAGAACFSWVALIGVDEIPFEREWFIGGLLAIGALFVGAPFLRALEHAERRTYWAILSAVTLAASAFLAYAFLPGGAPWGGWGASLFLTAGVACGAAIALAGARRDAGDEPAVIAFTWAATAIAAGTAWVTLERWEIGVAWSLLALLLVVIDRRAPLFRSVEWLVTPLLLASAARLLLNPMLAEYPIGSHPLWNWLPLGYGLPALAAGITGAIVARGRRAEWSPLFSGLAVALTLALVHWLVRHAFHPDAPTLIGGEGTTAGEGLAYSVTWIVSSLTLIGLSLWKRSRALRYTGLAFMVAAVGKVFLWDTRSLEDLYRVASYFGLGVSLILLSWAYHRLIPAWEERIERGRGMAAVEGGAEE